MEQDLIILVFIALAVGPPITAMILGVIAWLRTGKQNEALRQAHARIAALEETVTKLALGMPAPGMAPAPPPPAPAPAAQPTPVAAAAAAAAAPVQRAPADAVSEPLAPAAPAPAPALAEAALTPAEPVTVQAAAPAEPEVVVMEAPAPVIAALEAPPAADAVIVASPVAAAEGAGRKGAFTLPPAPPRAKPAAPAKQGGLLGLERALASNWFVWMGAGIIALAIVFFLNYASQEGWFGPTAQLAAVITLGVALIGGAEWLKRSPPKAAAIGQMAKLPAILAAAGAFAFFAAAWAGFAVLRSEADPALPLLPAAAAFGGFVLAAAAAVGLSLRHGRWLAGLGLVGGYLAPALTSDGFVPKLAMLGLDLPFLFPYVFAVTAAALTLIRWRKWPMLVWIAAFGALGWGVLWTTQMFDPRDQTMAAAFMVGIAALGGAFAWRGSSAPLELIPAKGAKPAPISQAQIAALVMMGVSTLVVLTIITRGGHESGPLTMLVALCAGAVALATFREGLALTPLIAAAAACVALLAWPSETRMIGDNVVSGINLTRLVGYAGAFGLIFSIGGWLMMARNREAWSGATLAALGPIGVLFAAQHVAGGFGAGPLWGGAALMLAAINAIALERMVSTFGGAAKAPGAVAAYTLGAAAAAALGVAYSLAGSGIWLAAALACLVPAFAWLERRFQLPALKVAAGITAAIVVWRLVVSLEPLGYEVGRTPLFNSLLPGYAIAVAAFILAARLFDETKDRNDTRLVQGLEAGALLLGAAGLGMQVRHIANGGDLAAPYATIGEAGGHTLILLGFAFALAARFGPKPRPLLRWVEVLAFSLGLAHIALLGVLVFNPWWGAAPSPAPGVPLFNVLLVAYGIPALLLAIYAVMRRRQGMEDRARIAGVAAVILGFLWVTLEVRRLFQGANGMAEQGMLAFETWMITAAWILYAALLLGLGFLRGRPELRFASLGVVGMALAKAFLVDVTTLEGVMRPVSFLLLGAALIGIAVFYQRMVFQTQPPPRAFRNPNLTPPAPGL